MLKDIGIATELGRTAQLPTPISALTQQLWRAAALANDPDASVSAMARWVEQHDRHRHHGAGGGRMRA